MTGMVFSVVVRVGLGTRLRATTALESKDVRQLFEEHGLPFAKHGRACLLHLAFRAYWPSIDGVDGPDRKLAGRGLDQFHLDIRNIFDEDIAHFDNLDLDVDEVQVVIVIGSHGLGLHAEAERLDSLGSVRSALETRWDAHMSVGQIRENRGSKSIGDGIRVRIQFVSVHSEALNTLSRLDGEVQLQMARNDFLVLGVATTSHAPRAFQSQGPSLGNLRNYSVGIDFGRDGKGCDGITIAKRKIWRK